MILFVPFLKMDRKVFYTLLIAIVSEKKSAKAEVNIIWSSFPGWNKALARNVFIVIMSGRIEYKDLLGARLSPF